MKVVFDTCIVIDVLQRREPFCADAMKLVNAVSDQTITGILTAKSITDIYYLMRKNLHSEEAARELLGKLFILFEVEDTYSVDCHGAIASPVIDYEDAVMVQTAKRVGADCIVTRNRKDYAKSDVPFLSPQELLGKIVPPANS